MKKGLLLFTLIFALILQNSYATRLIISGGPQYPLIFAGTGKKELCMKFNDATSANEFGVYVEAKHRLDKSIIIGNSVILESNGAAHREVKLSLDFPELGLYDYTVTLKDNMKGETLAVAHSNIAIVPQRYSAGPTDFGTCTHFAQNKGLVPYSLDLIRLAGFSSIRDEVYWGDVEKPIGTFKFSAKYDHYIQAASDRDIRVLISLEYGNPAPGEKVANRGFPLDESGRKRFARYAEELVKRYGDKVTLWEIWNEPSKALGIDPGTSYYELLKETYTTIKALQPNSTVICSGGAPNLVDGAYLTPIFQSGGVKYMDGFAMHTYVAPFNPEDGYRTKGHPFLKNVSVSSLWPHYKKMIETYSKKSKPLTAWITEMGWFQADTLIRDDGEILYIDEARQAAYITRLYLMSRRYNTTSCVYVYDFQNDGTNIKEKEHNFGIIRKDFSPKAAYCAVSVLSSLLENKPFSNALVDTEDTKVFCYGSGKDQVIALWNVSHSADPSKEVAETIELDLKSKEIIYVNWLGQKNKMTSSTGKYVLPLMENPSYIITNDEMLSSDEKTFLSEDSVLNIDNILKINKKGLKQIFDATGRFILKTTKDNIDMSMYPLCIYFVRVGNKTFKILKSN